MIPPGEYTPRHGDSQGIWNAWAAKGQTLDDRRERLAMVPPELRAVVESHLRTVFAVRARHRARVKNV